MSDNFNADQFMQTEVEGTLETVFVPIPEAEYPGFIKEVKPDSTPNGSDLIKVIWVVDDQSVRELIGQEEPTAEQTVWLDVNEQGALEFGINKNVSLGRLREALGQNDGKPWSPLMLLGQPAVLDIKHRLGSEGGTFPYVKSVRAA